MLPLWALLRVYAPVILLPVSAVIGFIGYNLERILSDKYTPYKPSIEDQRDQRQLAEEEVRQGGPVVDTLKEHKFVPPSIFDRNLSPALQKLHEKQRAQQQPHNQTNPSCS